MKAPSLPKNKHHIGVTGGIGSGKSTATQFLREQGFPVFCADAAAREVLSQKKVRQEILKQFGGKAFNAEGELDRAWMAKAVFSQPTKLKQLNAIIHPAVRENMSQWAKQQSHSILIYDIPLLFETGLDQMMDQTIVIWAPLKMRQQRLSQFRKIPYAESLRRNRQQMALKVKRRLADHVIINDSTQEKMFKLLSKLIQEL